MSRPLDVIVSVAIGGAIGSVARYLLTGAVASRLNTTFPLGTLMVNVVGCVAIGMLMHVALNLPQASPAVRALLITGLCGGFTTFSTFSWETMAAIEEGEFARAAWYVGGSVVLGLLAVWVGREVAGLALNSLRGGAA